MQEESNNQPFRFKHLFKTRWNPRPLDRPKVDPDLEHLPALTRSAETIRFSILSTEFWISPKGQVREWLRNHTRLAVLLAIPAFLVIPIVTFVLWQLASWIVALVAIAGNLIVFPFLALGAAIVLTITYLLLKLFFSKN